MMGVLMKTSVFMDAKMQMVDFWSNPTLNGLV